MVINIPIILANQGAPWTRNVKIPYVKFINDVNYRCCLRSRISLYEGSSSSLLPVQEFVSIFYNLIHTELHVFHFWTGRGGPTNAQTPLRVSFRDIVPINGHSPFRDAMFLLETLPKAHCQSGEGWNLSHWNHSNHVVSSPFARLKIKRFFEKRNEK